MTHVYMRRVSAIIGSGNGMSPLPQLVLNSKEQMYVGETEKLFQENYIWKNVFVQWRPFCPGSWIN